MGYIFQKTSQSIRQSEANSVPLENLPRFRNELQQLIQLYPIENVFNCDETALFYRLDPIKTLAHGSVTGRKKAKNRVTLMFTVSATGEKLKPLLIHKYQNPRPLNGIDKDTLPVHYYWNPTSWMQISIFEHWLCKLNEVMPKHSVARR